MCGILALCCNWYQPNLLDARQYPFSSRVENVINELLLTVSHLGSALDIAIILLLYYYSIFLYRYNLKPCMVIEFGRIKDVYNSLA